jgi:iron complex transport system substrate-binding protein
MPTAGEKGDTLRFKYAQLIEVVRHQGYTEVNIKNPWKEGKILHRYQLVSHSAAEMPDAANQATVVRIPLQRSVIFTSVHAALMQQLGGEDQVAGVADLKYMKVPFVQEGVQQGRIMDCGDGMSPLVEKIIDTQADGILLSPFENSGGYGRLEEINIPLIECAEYMEQSPLARAEWLRFYGILYGKEHEADSLFALVDSSYQALKAQVSEDAGIANGSAQSKRSNPLVLMDKQTGSVWYVPGGRSTIGRMLQDAQCRYPFATDEHSGSLPLSFETILEKCGDADVWLLRYDSNKPITRRQLLNEQPGYTQLRPAQTGEIYGCNVQTSMFYEESPFRPDLLLQDFIHILHPDIPNLPPLRYYQKLEN